MDMEDTSKLKIFSGNAHPELAKEICDYIGVPLGKAICGRFNNGEIQVMINESVRGKDCFIIQPTGAPVNDNLMELLIMVDAMKRASARHITVIVPYYGYARQDRKTRGREPISAKLVADLMSTAGVTRVVTMDLHAGQIQGFFDVPVDHLMSASILAKHVQSMNLPNLTIVSPDLGGVTRARELADRVHAPIAIIEKRRPEPGVAKVMNIIGNIQGRTCVLVDDIVDTAGSLCEGARALQEAGALNVYACVCHPVLTDPATERIKNSNIKQLIVTNSLPLEDYKREGLGDKIKVLSVAPLLGEAIMRIFHDASVSSLFDK
jgi:ribose-phosphate pyrophosphokinase